MLSRLGTRYYLDGAQSCKWYWQPVTPQHIDAHTDNVLEDTDDPSRCGSLVCLVSLCSDVRSTALPMMLSHACTRRYSTFFDLVQSVSTFFGGLCMWARAYYLHKGRVNPAHKAFKYGCIAAGCGVGLIAVSPLSLPGMYQVGGPDELLSQWWAGVIFSTIALQLFGLAYQLHVEHRYVNIHASPPTKHWMRLMVLPGWVL